MDAAYLKSEVGAELTRGITELLHYWPEDPIAFLSDYLRGVADRRDEAKQTAALAAQAHATAEHAAHAALKAQELLEDEQRLAAENARATARLARTDEALAAEPSLQSVQSEQAGESSVQAPVVQDPVSEAGKFGGSHSEPSSIEADVRLPTAETPTEGEASDALLGEQHVSSEQDTEATAVEAEADS